MTLSLTGGGMSMFPVSSAPTGAAGGVLGGTYPNPTFASGSLTMAGPLNVTDNVVGNAVIASGAAMGYNYANQFKLSSIGLLDWGSDGGLGSEPDLQLRRLAAGHIRVGIDRNGTVAGTQISVESIALAAVTVATLPGTPAAGMTAYVSDGAAGLAWGATVTGGSTTKYLVWYNGTNWTVSGK